MECVLDCASRDPASSRSGRGPMGGHCSRTGRAPERCFAPDAGERRRGLPVLSRERGDDAAGGFVAAGEGRMVAARGSQPVSGASHRDPARARGAGPLRQHGGCGRARGGNRDSRPRKTLADQSVDQIESVLRAWQERMADLSRDGRLKSLIAFKNQGVSAGATLSHAHSQLIALPFVPDTLETEPQAARRHYEAKERCSWCDIVAQEVREKERIVLESEDVVALSPWAARSPFELWILPRGHGSSFE